MANDVKKLYRSETDRMIAGICGGIGETYTVDSTIIRLVFAAVALFTLGTAVLIYLLAWIIIPEAPGS